MIGTTGHDNVSKRPTRPCCGCRQQSPGRVLCDNRGVPSPPSAEKWVRQRLTGYEALGHKDIVAVVEYSISPRRHPGCVVAVMGNDNALLVRLNKIESSSKQAEAVLLPVGLHLVVHVKVVVATYTTVV